jgi:carbonic anhydrase
MTSTRCASLLLVGAAACALGCGPAQPAAEPAGPSWSYSDSEGWGNIAPEYAACKTGTAQSPIDIPSLVNKAKLAPLALSYDSLPLRVKNDGHTIRVEGGKTSTLTLGSSPAEHYELAQLHFHSPSEHTIAGQAFELEMHLVHKNATGGIAVLAVLFKKGKEQPGLSAILDTAPMEPKTTKEATGVRLDPTTLLPDTSDYVTYTGSLTAPPCTEGVTWLVLSATQDASPEQIKKLRDLLRVATNRPVQPVAGRQILARER